MFSGVRGLSIRQVAQRWFFYLHKISKPTSQPLPAAVIAWGGLRPIVGDWVVLVLDQPIADLMKFPKIRTTDSSEENTRMGSLWGHPMDRAVDDLFVSKNCHSWKRFFGALETDCDSSIGMSGGPFVAEVHGDQSIEGINSGTIELPFIKWNLLSSATDFGPTVNGLIRADRENTLEKFLKDNSENWHFKVLSPE